MESVRIPLKISKATATELRRYARFRNIKLSTIIASEVVPALAHVLDAYHIPDRRLEHIMARDKSFQRWKKSS